MHHSDSTPTDDAVWVESWDDLIVPDDAVPDGRLSLGTKDGKVIAAGRFRSILLVGGQRSGKTTSFAIPAMRTWRGSALSLSIRPDVFWATAALRRGRSHLIDIGAGLGGEGVGWSPVPGCEDYGVAVRRANLLCDAASGGGLEEAGFWFGFAELLLGSVLFAAALADGDIDTVVRWIRTQDDFEVRAVLMASGVDLAVEAYDAITELEPRTRGSIYATAMVVLRAYASPDALAAAVCGGFDVDELLRRSGEAAYLCAAPQDQRRMRPVVTCLVRDLLHRAYACHQTGTPADLLVCIDETANVVHLPELSTLATTAAGTGIQLMTVWHDVSQIQATYGDQARTIVNNHSAIVILPGNRDTATVRLADELVGEADLPGWTERGRSSAARLRQMAKGTALCVYEDLPATVIDVHGPGWEPAPAPALAPPTV